MIDTLLPIVLASGSPRRRELLDALGVRFEVAPTNVPEEPLDGESATDFAVRVARDKAVAGSRAAPGALVIGADTVVALGSLQLGKPSDEAEAVRFLLQLSDRTHQVLTAFCLARDGAPVLERITSTDVDFRALDEATARAYAATGEPADKAGAYAIQGRGAFLVRSIRGSYTNVVGLPIAELFDALVEVDAVRAADLP